MKKWLLAVTFLTASISLPAENENVMTQLEAISYETPYRILSNKDPQGFSVELDDGSIWRITDNGSASEVQTWRANDSLIIHPTLFNNLSGARFYLFNERLRSAAYAELSYGPLTGKATYTRITYIDYVNGEVQIQDGTGNYCFFRVRWADRYILAKWKYGQTIMLGSNEDCYAGWFTSCPYIMINIEQNDFVRATTE